jgi:hypothetical protein
MPSPAALQELLEGPYKTLECFKAEKERRAAAGQGAAKPPRHHGQQQQQQQQSQTPPVGSAPKANGTEVAAH